MDLLAIFERILGFQSLCKFRYLLICGTQGFNRALRRSFQRRRAISDLKLLVDGANTVVIVGE